MKPPLNKTIYTEKGYGIFDVLITKGFNVPGGKRVEFHGSPEVCTPYFTLKGKVTIEVKPQYIKLKCNKGDNITYVKTDPNNIHYEDIVNIISEINLISNNNIYRDELYMLVDNDKKSCTVEAFKRTKAYNELDIEFESEYFRIDYEHPLRVAFNKQKNIRLLSPAILKELSGALSTTPWYFCFNKHTKQYNLKEMTLDNFIYYTALIKKKYNPMIGTAIRLYHFIKQQRKLGHELFQKSTLFKDYYDIHYQTAYTHSDDKYQHEAIEFLMYHAIIEIGPNYLAMPKDIGYNRAIIRSLMRLNGNPELRYVDVPCIPSETLTLEQTNFIKHVYTNNVSFLEGPPGTGKTEVLVSLMAYFKKPLVVTHVGMMVDSLQSRFGNRVETAHTICSIITFYTYNKKAYDEWLSKYDILIIDEGSNIDSCLFSELLNCVSQVNRLVIVGDCGQIFPIKNGCPFFDLLQCFPQHSFQLTENKRVEKHAKALTEISMNIRQGNVIQFREDDDSVRFYKRPNTEKEQIEMLKNLLTSFPLHLPLTFQVITLTNNCKNMLNKLIEELLIEIKYLKKPANAIKLFGGFIYPGKKITFLKNTKPHPSGQYEGVKNGELGIVSKIVCQSDKTSYNLTLKSHKKILLSYHDETAVNPIYVSSGYATTCNKAQGSEWTHILFWIYDNPIKFFTREFAYVAVSRSKRQCIIIGRDEKDFHALCADKAKPRNTLLKYYLQTEQPDLLKEVEPYHHITLPTEFKLLPKNVAAVPIWTPDTTKKGKASKSNTNNAYEKE